MEYGTEHACIQILRHLLFSLKTFYYGIIELGRTRQIVLQCRCRKHSLLDLRYIILRLDDFRQLGGLHAVNLHRKTLQRKAEMIFQLLYITALLPRLQSFGTRINQHPHIFRTRYHPIEIIGPYRILKLISRKAEAPPQFRRHERRTYASMREYALIGRHYYNCTEVQSSGLQRSHDLQSLERFASERHRRHAYKLAKKPDIRHREYLHIHQTVLQHGHRFIILFRIFSLQCQLRVLCRCCRNRSYNLLLIPDKDRYLAPVLGLRIGYSWSEYRIEQRGSAEVTLRNIVLGSRLDPAYDLKGLLVSSIPEQGIREHIPYLFMVEMPAVPPYGQMQLHR